MAIKYSELTHYQHCDIHNGLLSIEELSGDVFTIDTGISGTFSSAESIELERGLVLAVCENQYAKFTLFHNFFFNVVEHSDHLLRDFGTLDPFKTKYVFELIGSAWYKGSYRGVFLCREIGTVFISDNVKTRYIVRMDAKELSTLKCCDESYCLSICRDYEDTAVCGNINNMYLLDIETGRVSRL